jgi:diguanylate cyclase (GGDEF)-like protein
MDLKPISKSGQTAFGGGIRLNGHSAGDQVLRAVATSLQPGPNVHAYRLGGEEFVLLLRGDDADIQAELRRQAISVTVANAVAGLSRPVTASMGITDIGDGEDFSTLYDRADKLLYEAKSAGRNRARSTFRQGPPITLQVTSAMAG